MQETIESYASLFALCGEWRSRWACVVQEKEEAGGNGAAGTRTTPSRATGQSVAVYPQPGWGERARQADHVQAPPERMHPVYRGRSQCQDRESVPVLSYANCGAGPRYLQGKVLSVLQVRYEIQGKMGRDEGKTTIQFPI